MESDKKLNPLAEFAKREDELSYFTKGEMIVLALIVLAIIGAIFYASITSSPDEETPAPIEAPMEHEPTQMEMNGWREPSAFDVIIHRDSGSQEPDTVGLSFFSSFLYCYKLDTIFFYPLEVIFKRLTGGDCLQNRRGGRKSDL